tara:strand:- start:7590 stop:7829 length:240 start_codon:yes stop_codon:yes gene_type:complete
MEATNCQLRIGQICMGLLGETPVHSALHLSRRWRHDRVQQVVFASVMTAVEGVPGGSSCAAQGARKPELEYFALKMADT